MPQLVVDDSLNHSRANHAFHYRSHLIASLARLALSARPALAHFTPSTILDSHVAQTGTHPETASARRGMRTHEQFAAQQSKAKRKITADSLRVGER